MRASILVLVLASVGCGGPQKPAGGASGASGGVEAPASPDRGAIEGVVRDLGTGGEPVSLAHVVAVSADPPARSGDVSDSGGHYRLPDLPPGRYRILASIANLRVEYDDVLVPAGKVIRVNVEFDSRAAREHATDGSGPDAPKARATGVIYGVVRDRQTGEILPGAVVSAFIDRPVDAPTTLAGDNGSYRLIGLAPGTYVVTVYYQLIDKGAVEIRRTNVAVERGQATRVDLEIDTRTNP